MIAGIYARVSTKEKAACPHCGKIVRASDYRLINHKDRAGQACEGSGQTVDLTAGQDTENQLIQQRKYAEAQGWEMVEFIDRETGKHADRVQLQSLFDAAARREIGVVLVWALDRFTREGVAETFIHIKKLRDYGVHFESLTEPHFRTTGPAGELMIAIAAWIAKQERVRISERTKAGLAAARAKGRVGGRPAKVFDRQRAHAMRTQDPPLSWRVIGRELGIAQSSVRKALNGVHKTSRRKAEKRAPNKT